MTDEMGFTVETGWTMLDEHGCRYQIIRTGNERMLKVARPLTHPIKLGFVHKIGNDDDLQGLLDAAFTHLHNEDVVAQAEVEYRDLIAAHNS